MGFISGRISYIILRGRWFTIIFLNAQVTSEDKTHDLNDNLYGETGRALDESVGTL
jgi:hypothetical protein